MSWVREALHFPHCEAQMFYEIDWNHLFFMDTDDLSEEAYEAVIVEADKFHHDLTIRFGQLADECQDENEYLISCKQLISELKKLKRDELPDIFFEDVPRIPDLMKALDRISKNIEHVMTVPMDRRRFTF